MGCYSSKGIIPSCRADPAQEMISKDSKKIVQDMWFELKPDVKNFGIQIFIRLFEEAPEAQELFYNFKDLRDQDELLQSLKELDHVARVMSAFGNSIELLDDKNQFVDTVQSLGKAHRKIGINTGHLRLFGEVVTNVLSNHCISSWTIQKKKAWKDFFALLTEQFGIGLTEENNNHVSS